MKRIARVFPRRTRATPTDELAFVGEPPMFELDVDEVHISVAFTWDLPEAERLAREWSSIAPVKIGGPATGMRGEEFVPGRYLKPGYVISSRGCPNRCWFCSVWKREGNTRELPITEGWNVLDDNLLACADEHIRAVFAMLKDQKHAVEFTGGLEAARLKWWHAEALRGLRPKQIFFAYDTEDDWEPLREAVDVMMAAGHTLHPHSHVLRCYVLVGYPGDTYKAAEERLARVLGLGLTPAAMLWRNDRGKRAEGDWSALCRRYYRPAITHAHGRVQAQGVLL